MTPKFYTFEELLPSLDATAKPYAETVADTYVIGIEYNGELFPLHTVATAAEADDITAEIDKSLEHHLTPVDEEAVYQDETLLDGFTLVPSSGMVLLTVGKRNRLYLKGAMKELLGIDNKKAKQSVLLAYNPMIEAFALVKPSSKAVSDEMRTANYFVSKRGDITCAKLFKQFNLDKFEGQTFYVDTASLSGDIVIFRR